MRVDRGVTPLPDTGDDAVLVLQPVSDAPCTARAFVAQHCRDLPAGMCEDVQLLVSEIVTNAVRHSGTAIVLRVRVTADGVGIQVADTGAAIPAASADHPHAPTPKATHGRGLGIVAVVATSWGIEDTNPPPGKTVWFELRTTTGSTG